jgi:hypothetical protein
MLQPAAASLPASQLSQVAGVYILYTMVPPGKRGHALQHNGDIFVYPWPLNFADFPRCRRLKVISNYTAKKAHGIIVCRGSISMYREEISTAWKGQKNSIHLWKYSLQYKLQFPYPLLPLPSNEFHRSMEYFHGYVE